SLVEAIGIEGRGDCRVGHEILQVLREGADLIDVAIDLDQHEIRLTACGHVRRGAITVRPVHRSLAIWKARERAAEFLLERGVAANDQHAQTLVAGRGSWVHNGFPTWPASALAPARNSGWECERGSC